jgi:hypothetical protein
LPPPRSTSPWSPVPAGACSTSRPHPVGGTDPYLRDQTDGRVFVVQRSILTDFQAAATSLVEHHLHGFRLEDADRVSMTAGSAKKEFRVAHSADGRRRGDCLDRGA